MHLDARVQTALARERADALRATMLAGRRQNDTAGRSRSQRAGTAVPLPRPDALRRVAV